MRYTMNYFKMRAEELMKRDPVTNQKLISKLFREYRKAAEAETKVKVEKESNK